MPNWITNELHIQSNKNTKDIKKEFSEMLEKITTIEEGKKNFDFNKIIPMPKELKNTTSPTEIISDFEFTLQQAKIENNEKIFTKGITKEISNRLKKQYGFDNWYDWANMNWGTKWNTSNTYIDALFISFETAWATPLPIIKQLSKNFPNLTIKLKFADEDIGYNCGTIIFENGEIINLNLMKGGNIEAYKFALNIRGNDLDYYNSATENILIGDLTNDDLTPTAYFTAMIDMELENCDYHPNEVENVMKFAIKCLTKQEDYIRASKIKDYLANK